MNVSIVRHLSIAACVLATLLLPHLGIAQDQPQQVLITNVNIFDGTTNGLANDMSVLITGNLISTVSGEPIAVNRSANVTVIDGGGRTLMPGLIDSHVHLNMTYLEGGVNEIENKTWEEIGALATVAARDYLMDGYTTVRDMGGMSVGLRNVIDRGYTIGPRLYVAGAAIGQTAGHGDWRLASQTSKTEYNVARLRLSAMADGRPEVLAAVRQNLAEGADFIKIMVGGGISSIKDPLHTSQFTDDEISAAVEAAAQWDTYVAAHVYDTTNIRRALELGLKVIDHGQFIDEPTARLLKEKGAYLSPNLAALHPDLFKHPLFSDPTSPTAKKAREFVERSANLAEVVKKVGVKLLLNTDAVYSSFQGVRAQRDFEKWTLADFFGNFEALKAMTSHGGEVAALTGQNNPYPGKLGIVEEGAYADLLIVDGNPLTDITVVGGNPKWLDAEPREEGIETIRLIMKDGKIYKNTL